jgi:hypothetical protein
MTFLRQAALPRPLLASRARTSVARDPRASSRIVPQSDGPGSIRQFTRMIETRAAYHTASAVHAGSRACSVKERPDDDVRDTRSRDGRGRVRPRHRRSVWRALRRKDGHRCRHPRPVASPRHLRPAWRSQHRDREREPRLTTGCSLHESGSSSRVNHAERLASTNATREDRPDCLCRAVTQHKIHGNGPAGIRGIQGVER